VTDQQENERQGNSISVARDVGELRSVREWLHQQLEPWSNIRPEACEEVAVMTNELLTNAIRHTDSVPVLTVLVTDGRIRVSVRDEDPNLPVVLPIDVQRPSGNGMRIVAAWAEKWGTDRLDGDGKDVWFTVCT
jgi:anti-sigma regulatory factor (Ser/Thr protein kinase)